MMLQLQKARLSTIQLRDILRQKLICMYSSAVFLHIKVNYPTFQRILSYYEKYPFMQLDETKNHVLQQRIKFLQKILFYSRWEVCKIPLTCPRSSQMQSDFFTHVSTYIKIYLSIRKSRHIFLRVYSCSNKNIFSCQMITESLFRPFFILATSSKMNARKGKCQGCNQIVRVVIL